MENKRKGITLISLVITIIVLLILAGITINLTIGQDGIITKAGEAGKTYQNAETKEQGQLGDLEASIMAGKVARTENNVQYVGDGMGNLIPVPVGFSYLEGSKNTGLVIKDTTKNADGTPTATNGNEYVWIPVDNTTLYRYDRYAFSRDGWEFTQTKREYDNSTSSYKIIRADQASYYYAEAMPNIAENRTELQSVTQYKGFYIGRYEVGIVGYTTPTKSNSSNLTNWTGYSNGTAVVQKGKQVWNYITRDKAKEIAESMYSDNNAVTSRLCSSYAWDTALKFIETNYPEYLTNSLQGNYKDTTFEYTDLDGTTKKTKAKDKSILVPTGQTTAVNNIYDMGGNVSEWTTEVCSATSSPCTDYGGGQSNYTSNHPAAVRRHNTMSAAYADLGFRSTLYL